MYAIIIRLSHIKTNSKLTKVENIMQTYVNYKNLQSALKTIHMLKITAPN